MEVLILSIALFVISLVLAIFAGFVMFHSLTLINAMNKRVIYLLEKLYSLMGLTSTQNIEDITQEIERMEKQVNDTMNRNPERYNPHTIVEEMNDLDL